MAEKTYEENIFREVASKAPIRDVIAFELGPDKIIKKGNGYVCLCPFHNDHSPSMQINPKRNTFKCFVDGAGGDPIKFVELYEKISPLEALKKVCQICSIPLPASLQGKKTFVPTVEREYKPELEALLTLKKFYQLTLKAKSGEEGREYLAKRKLPEDAINHFGIGFAPEDDTEAIQSLRKQGFEVKTLERAGILTNSVKLSDRYSARLMFPIEDRYGHVVGFSGRKVREDQEGGKYINYPETPLFRKSEILYHYAQARQTAHQDGYVYLVEGFMDVIAFYRAGINSAVGTMGTALTDDGAEALKALNCEVRLCLDSDEPGQEGDERCLPILLSHQVPFRVVRRFKTGKDADEVFTNGGENGKEALRKEAFRLYDPFLFLLGRALLKSSNPKKMTDSLQIQSFLKEASPYYFALDEISRARDLETLSKVTDLEKDVLLDLLRQKDRPIERKTEKKENTSRPYKVKRDYRKEGYPPTEHNFVPEIQLDSSLHKAPQNIADLYQLAKDCPSGKDLYPALIENETNLVLSLAYSRTGFMAFQSTYSDFAFPPYYALANLMSLLYVRNHDLNYLQDDSFDKLSEAVKKLTPSAQAPEVKTETEDEDDSDDDLFDDPTEDASNIVAGNLSQEDIVFLQEAIELMRNLPLSTYNEDGFNRDLELHPLYIRLDSLIRSARLKEGAKESTETMLKRLKLEADIRRLGGKTGR